MQGTILTKLWLVVINSSCDEKKQRKIQYKVHFYQPKKQRQVNTVNNTVQDQDAIQTEETKDQNDSETLNGTLNLRHFQQAWKLKHSWLITIRKKAQCLAVYAQKCSRVIHSLPVGV